MGAVIVELDCLGRFMQVGVVHLDTGIRDGIWGVEKWVGTFVCG
jgi:hypothetical protein